MANISTRKIVICAMLTALTTLATIVIQIPSPMNGYVNLGDVVVLFATFIMGPVYGTVSAGLGSFLADILTGYVVYAPATLIIKAGMALACYFTFAALKKVIKSDLAPMVVGGVVAELIMVAGYFLSASLLMGEGIAAAARIPGNLIQGAVGVAVGVPLSMVFVNRNPFEKNK